jgi:hypothetical protein
MSVRKNATRGGRLERRRLRDRYEDDNERSVTSLESL